MRFCTYDLFSRWGFGDGDMLDDFFDDNRVSLPINGRRHVLGETIRRHVIPRIDQKVEIPEGQQWDWTLNHNPVRADKVNGIAVDDCGENPDIVLTPEYVDVDDEIILAIAREPTTPQ